MEMFAYALIMMVCSALLSAVFAAKPQEPSAGTLDDFDMPQVDEGTPQAVIFGECWSGDWQVLSFGNLRTAKVYAKSGKK